MRHTDMIWHPWLCSYIAWSVLATSIFSVPIRVAAQSDSAQASSAATANSTSQNLDPEAISSEELANQIRRLVAQLGDANYHQRVSAEWQLQRMGLAAFEQLHEAANTSEDIQIANAARYIIESQNVIWWQDTDSVDVRSFLKDYGRLDKDKRSERIQLLSAEDSADAWLALCRLARYERFEDLSKASALALMEVLSRQDDLPADVARSIEFAIGKGQRPAVQWLRLLVKNFQSPSVQDFKQWEALVEAERLVERPDDRGESQRQLLGLYKWIGDWLTKKLDRAAALRAVRPSLELVRDEPYSIRDFTFWALDSDMPELVHELAGQHKAAFETNGDLAYMLAESHLRAGNPELAETLAQHASEQVGPSEEAKAISKNFKITGLVARDRYRLAVQLSSRGLFDWAETEYKKALEEDSERYDETIRETFSQFYWFGGENAKAAAVLKPMLEPSQNRSQEFLETVQATYYFYDGLAKIDANDQNGARESLRVAFEKDGNNPDVVIAMKPVATTPDYKEFYEQCFVTMRDRYRMQVVMQEEHMARAADRDQRRRAEAELANACNQLAWLLSKCEQHPQEAVQLSERSLELQPDQSVFLDTLARCYFSNGEIEKAISTQSRAVALSPHERQMIAQLREFETALKAQATPTENSPKDSGN